MRLRLGRQHNTSRPVIVGVGPPTPLPPNRRASSSSKVSAPRHLARTIEREKEKERKKTSILNYLADALEDVYGVYN